MRGTLGAIEKRNTNSMNKKVIAVNLITTIIIGLMFFAHSFHRYDRGFKYDLTIISIALLTLILLLIILIELYFIFKQARHKNTKSYLFLITPTLALILINSPVFEDEVLVPTKFVSCYEGTQNTSRGYFRIDNSFEIHATGVFGYNKWHTGKWRINKDTLFLKYETDKHKLLSDTNIINSDNTIIPISRDFKNGFYLGDCKGLN